MPIVGSTIPIGVGLGFAGVIVALRPGAQALGLGHMAALASALVFAISILMLRRIRVGETDVAPVAVLLGMLNLLALALTSWPARPGSERSPRAVVRSSPAASSCCSRGLGSASGT